MNAVQGAAKGAVSQLKEVQSGTLGKVVELWVAAAVQRCSATEQF